MARRLAPLARALAISRRMLAPLCACALFAPAPAPAAPRSPWPGADTARTVRMVPAPWLAGEAIRHVLYGREYRDLWTHAVTLPVLPLGALAAAPGAIRPQRDDSGTSLLIDGSDGRAYVFDVLPRRLPRAEQGDARFPRVQDSESSAHPAASVIASALFEAAGLPHAHPVLAVLPDDSTLGDARAEFAGRMGVLEERPGSPDSGPGAEGAAVRVAGTRELLDSLRAGPASYIDARAYLAARLVDFVLGDFEDGAVSWVWTRAGDGPDAPWRPLPPDANRRLSKAGGLIRIPLRDPVSEAPREREFEALDRELLSELDGAAWDSVAAAVRSKLDDRALIEAVDAMPAAMRPASAADLVDTFRRRRAALARFARGDYGRLSAAADLSTTDAPELACIDRLDGRHVEVRIGTAAADGSTIASLRFRRLFDRRETGEVRLHLRGDGGEALVRGPGRGGIVLRIVSDGTGGALVDSSRAGGVHLYDAGGVVRVAGLHRVELDSKPYVAMAAPPPRGGRTIPPNPDYGRTSGFSSWRAVGPWGGFFLGGRYSVERFGFREPQFASRTSVRAGYSPRLGGYEIDVSHEARMANSGLSGSILLRTSRNDRVRFFGTGNETPIVPPRSGDAFRVPQTVYEIVPSVGLDTSHRVHFTAGLPFTLVQMDESQAGDSVRALDLEGWGPRRQLGGLLGVSYGRSDAPERQRAPDGPGARGDLMGRYYMKGGGLTGGYGTLEGSSALVFAPSAHASPSLTLRAGGKKIWGPHPFDEEAYLGGRLSLPGMPDQQYAGDAAIYLESEQVVRLARIRAPVRGELGLLALEDTGRVWVDGERSSRWHTGAGPGIWFSPAGSNRRVSVALVRSESRTSVSFRGGLGF